MGEEPRGMADGGVSCPKDGGAMERVHLVGIAVDRCGRCGGVWLDRGELRALLDAGGAGRGAVERLEGLGVEARGAEEERPQPLLCPRDHSRMSVHRDPRQQQVEYDLCPKCGGVFFDAGELADLTKVTLGERVRGMLG